MKWAATAACGAVLAASLALPTLGGPAAGADEAAPELGLPLDRTAYFIGETVPLAPVNSDSRPTSFTPVAVWDLELDGMSQRMALTAQANARYPNFGGFCFGWDPTAFPLGAGFALEAFSNLLGGMNRSSTWQAIRGTAQAEGVLAGRDFLDRFAALALEGRGDHGVGSLERLHVGTEPEPEPQTERKR